MTYKEFRQKDSSFDLQDLIAMAYGRLVDDPPEHFDARLPAPPLLMVDRILSMTADGRGGTIIAEQDIRLDCWYFQCHMPGDPVQPGCLSVDAVWQLLGFYCAWRGGTGDGQGPGLRRSDCSAARSGLTTNACATRWTSGAFAPQGVGGEHRYRRREHIRGRGTDSDSEPGPHRGVQGHLVRGLSRKVAQFAGRHHGQEQVTMDKPVAIVTGAGTGIGSACCRALARKGFLSGSITVQRTGRKRAARLRSARVSY